MKKKSTYKPWYKDKKVLAEVEKRTNELKTGKVKGVLWEEIKASVLTSREDRREKDL